mgnify:CR=1 FL=1
MHNALGGPSHDSQLARKERQILCRAYAYDRWQKNQTWVSTGLSVTGNESKARQIMLDMLGEKPEQAAPPDMLSVTLCAAGWRMSGIAWTRSPTKATRYRPGRIFSPTSMTCKSGCVMLTGGDAARRTST